MVALFDNNELALPDECPECGLSFTVPWHDPNYGIRRYPLFNKFLGGLVHDGLLVIPTSFDYGGDLNLLCFGPFSFPIVCARCGNMLYDEAGDYLVGGLTGKPAIDTIITTGETEVK